MTDIQTIPYSRMAKSPYSVFEPIVSADIRITRRDYDPLIVTTEDRYETAAEYTRILATIVRALDPTSTAAVRAALIQALPWLADLEPSERSQAETELLADLRRSLTCESVVPFMPAMESWRAYASDVDER